MEDWMTRRQDGNWYTMPAKFDKVEDLFSFYLSSFSDTKKKNKLIR